MEIISFVVCTQKSKIILARQFKLINKMQLENHIIEFTRKLYSSSKETESTIVESDSARFLYVKIETLFLVAISEKNSNIIETTKVLKMVFDLIQDVCKLGIDYFDNYRDK